MNDTGNRLMFSDVLQEIDYYDKDRKLHRQKNDVVYLSEKDFYPPLDNRILKSYIKDVKGGDNFAEYCEYIFSLYEEEGYYD